MIQSDAWRNLVVFGQVYRDVAKGCAGRDEMIAFVVHFHLTFVLIDCNEYQLYTVAFFPSMFLTIGSCVSSGKHPSTHSKP